MKKLSLIFFFFGIVLSYSQESTQKEPFNAEVSCGQCNFKMKDKIGCDLAIKIDDKTYFVEGTHLDDHGDAHADDGLCSTIRKAEVKGEIKNNKFYATSFKLLPLKE
jgi:hypothetical protein